VTKLSPPRFSFNGGVWGPSTLGRTDHERYPASLVESDNFIPLTEGVASRRSGTALHAPYYDETKKIRLVPFNFAADQSLMLEFAPGRVRIHSGSGVLLDDEISVTSIVTDDPFVVEVSFDADESLAAGDQVFISGFDHFIDTQYATVDAVNGNQISLSGVDASGVTFQSGATLTKVFHIDSDYTEAHLANLRFVQSQDVVYLFSRGKQDKTLTRKGLLNWELQDRVRRDGPYFRESVSGATLTPNKRGDVATVGSNAFSSSASTGNADDNAFDDDLSSFWESNDFQEGTLGIDLTAQTKVLGLTIFYPEVEKDGTTLPEDYAPKSFSIQGSNTSSTSGFETIQTFKGYQAWQNGRSEFLDFSGAPDYQYYRIVVEALGASGEIKPRIARLAFMPALDSADSLLTLTLSDASVVNGGDGFVSTDVGRHVRLRGSDTFWRWAVIEQVDSTTQVKARLQGDPLPDVSPIREWRLGLYSDTTGWPAVGAFFEDRMCLGGPESFPNAVAMSVTGAYDIYAPTNGAGDVLDTSAILAVLNSRKVGTPRWLMPTQTSLIVGTINGDWALTAAENGAVTATNLRAEPITTRGSAFVDPVLVDSQVLRIDRAGRKLNELVFSADTEGFKSPDLSVFAPHLGVNGFSRIVFAESPNNIAWLIDKKGDLFGFTYERDQGVLSWHQHSLGGTDVEIEDIEVLPDEDADEDQVWLAVKRTIGATTRRYIEKMTPTWRAGLTLDDAFFVDSGIAASVTGKTLGGYWHLEGEQVAVLVDGSPLGGLQTVAGGEIELPFNVDDKRVVVGLPYDAMLKTTGIEADMPEGRSEGKVKKIRDLVIRLWDTGVGQFGREGALDQLVFREVTDPIGEPVPLFTGQKGPFNFPPGHNLEAPVMYFVDGAIPLPANVVALYPQIDIEASR